MKTFTTISFAACAAVSRPWTLSGPWTSVWIRGDTDARFPRFEGQWAHPLGGTAVWPTPCGPNRSSRDWEDEPGFRPAIRQYSKGVHGAMLANSFIVGKNS